jgi:NlpE N-terminal domain
MKQFMFFSMISLLVLITANSNSQSLKGEKSSIEEIFIASTPCSAGTKPLPGIPANADCELIKWNLTLYNDGSGGTSTYKLIYTYGQSKQGTTGFIGGGKKVEMKGKWTIIKNSASNSHLIIYQLNDSNSNRTISFARLNNNLLHLLDAEQHFMIGNAAWSYTLNRVNIK